MKNVFSKILLPALCISAFLIILTGCRPPVAPNPFSDQAPLIAHGAGIVRKNFYTNSLEAVEENYQAGHRFFEMDLEWTSDNQLVMLHDWKITFQKLFNRSDGPVTLQEFMNTSMNSGLTQLSLPQLIEWLDQHPDVHIVTDMKTNSFKGLIRIRETDPRYGDHFIPQAYSFEEFDEIKKLGYPKVILTIYQLNWKKENFDQELTRFAQEHASYAVTMPQIAAETTQLPQKLDAAGVFVYVHTINKWTLVESLKKSGVDGFYTDMLTPPKK